VSSFAGVPRYPVQHSARLGGGRNRRYPPPQQGMGEARMYCRDLLHAGSALAQLRLSRARTVAAMVVVAWNQQASAQSNPLEPIPLGDYACIAEREVYLSESQIRSSTDPKYPFQAFPVAIQIAKTTSRPEDCAHVLSRGTWLSTYCGLSYQAHIALHNFTLYYYGDQDLDFRGLAPSEYIMIDPNGFFRLSLVQPYGVFIEQGHCIQQHG
jgi:hypothetical protein